MDPHKLKILMVARFNFQVEPDGFFQPFVEGIEALGLAMTARKFGDPPDKISVFILPDDDMEGPRRAFALLLAHRRLWLV